MDVSFLSSLYHTHIINDFPPEERKPLETMLQLLQEGLYQVTYHQENDILKAYALFFTGHETLQLLDYYAVAADFRGQGIGSAFLKDVLKNTPKPVVVELEAPEAAPLDKERQRRIAFYRALGFQDTGIRGTLFEVPFHYYIYGNRKAVSIRTLTALYQGMFSDPKLANRFRLWSVTE